MGLRAGRLTVGLSWVQKYVVRGGWHHSNPVAPPSYQCHEQWLPPRGGCTAAATRMYQPQTINILSTVGMLPLILPVLNRHSNMAGEVGVPYSLFRTASTSGNIATITVESSAPKSLQKRVEKTIAGYWKSGLTPELPLQCLSQNNLRANRTHRGLAKILQNSTTVLNMLR